MIGKHDLTTFRQTNIVEITTCSEKRPVARACTASLRQPDIHSWCRPRVMLTSTTQSLCARQFVPSLMASQMRISRARRRRETPILRPRTAQVGSRSYSSLHSPLGLIVANLQALIRSSSPLKQLGIRSRELNHLLPIMLPTTVESEQLNSRTLAKAEVVAIRSVIGHALAHMPLEIEVIV